MASAGKHEKVREFLNKGSVAILNKGQIMQLSRLIWVFMVKFVILLVPYQCFTEGDFRFTCCMCVHLSNCPSVCPSFRKIWILR